MSTFVSARALPASSCVPPRGAVSVVDGCTEPLCDRPVASRGLCEMHYRRVLRATGASQPRTTPPAHDRFWNHVEVTDTCWLWTGALTSRGYPTLSVGGRTIRAHRWSYEHFVGPIADGLVIDHLCCTPRCVNPNHLEAVTQLVNHRRYRQAAAALVNSEVHGAPGFTNGVAEVHRAQALAVGGEPVHPRNSTF